MPPLACSSKRIAAVERRRDVVPCQLQQSRALQCGVAAAAERFLKACRHFGGREIAVGRGDDERRAGHDTQDLRDPLTGLEERDAARSEMGVIGKAIPAGVNSGSRSAAVRQLRTVCTASDQSTRYSIVCSCSLRPIAWVRARPRPRVNSAFDSQP